MSFLTTCFLAGFLSVTVVATSAIPSFSETGRARTASLAVEGAVIPDRRAVTIPDVTAPVAATSTPGGTENSDEAAPLRLPGSGVLLVPESAPDPDAPSGERTVARVTIPRLGLSADVGEGVEQESIDRGPAWWPGTAMAGGWGTMVIAGHRTTYTAPFLRVEELAPGDLIDVSAGTETYSYAVTGLEVVPPTALWIVNQQPGYNLLLFTCHPLGGDTERLVVRAALVSRNGVPVVW